MLSIVWSVGPTMYQRITLFLTIDNKCIRYRDRRILQQTIIRKAGDIQNLHFVFVSAPRFCAKPPVKRYPFTNCKIETPGASRRRMVVGGGW